MPLIVKPPPLERVGTGEIPRGDSRQTGDGTRSLRGRKKALASLAQKKTQKQKTASEMGKGPVRQLSLLHRKGRVRNIPPHFEQQSIAWFENLVTTKQSGEPRTQGIPQVEGRKAGGPTPTEKYAVAADGWMLETASQEKSAGKEKLGGPPKDSSYVSNKRTPKKENEKISLGKSAGRAAWSRKSTLCRPNKNKSRDSVWR